MFFFLYDTAQIRPKTTRLTQPNLNLKTIIWFTKGTVSDIFKLSLSKFENPRHGVALELVLSRCFKRNLRSLQYTEGDPRGMFVLLGCCIKVFVVVEQISRNFYSKKNPRGNKRFRTFLSRFWYPLFFSFPRPEIERARERERYRQRQRQTKNRFFLIKNLWFRGHGITNYVKLG